MRKNKLFYHIVKGGTRLLYPYTELFGLENLPREGAVIVSNHAQIHGPITCELFFPEERYIWCAGEMMHMKEVPHYAYTDFWSQKPGYTHWFYKALSYLIAPLSACVFTNADIIPVFRDTRMVATFRTTVEKLQAGAKVIIFPECSRKHNAIVYEFQDKFVDTARFYYKKTGKALSFVPMYIAPRLHQMCLGKPVVFRPDAPIAEERRRICDKLMEEITVLAQNLPVHRVIPYRNIPKKLYPTNRSTEVFPHEDTHR